MRKRGEARAVSPEVEETSEKLAEALEESSREGFRVETAHPTKLQAVPPPLQRLVETIFVKDVEGLYRRLRKDLEPVEVEANRGSYAAALDAAEHRAREAHELYTTVEIMRTRWENGNEVVFTSMRDEAMRVLQNEKDAKLRSKAVTEADVRATSAKLFGDEWEHVETKRKEFDLLVDSCKNLVDAWFSRCKSLQTLLSKQR
jgi:hypothetical protein